MPQNIYDDPAFFAAYDRMRTHGLALAGALEEPAIRSLMPDVGGLNVLDLGCGTGGMSRWLVGQGAASVTGVDISERMLARAAEEPHVQIEYIQAEAESLEFPDGSFDLVVSSLMFHYIDDLRTVLSRIRRWLKPGGSLVFSTEHPIYTAAQGIHTDQWLKDDSGEARGWIVDSYSDEGKRTSTWWVDGVIRYHRTVATLVNWLVDLDFRITRLLEPHATEEAEREHPIFLDERKRPVFLFVSASVGNSA